MVALGAHRAAVQQRDVARQIHGHGMLLAERGQRVELRHVAQRELVEVHAGVDGDERVERALGQRIHVLAQAALELGELVGGKRHAHGGLVPAEAQQQVGAAFHGLEQVDLAHAAAAAARLVAVDGEQQAGHAVGVHQATGNDALHALVPPFAGHHQGALPLVGFGGLGLGDLGELGLDGAALVVDALEALRLLVGLLEVVGEQKAERQLRVAHAAGGVQARDDGEAEVGGGDLLTGGAGGVEQRGDARARGLVDAAQAVGHQGAVLVAHGHEVGDGAERGEVGVLTPQVRLAEAPAQRLHHLERHANAGQDGAGAGGVALRVGHGHALGHQVGRLVMIGDGHFDAALLQQAHLRLAGDAAVDGDQEVGLDLRQTLDGRRGDGVALLEAARDKRRDARSELAQTARHDGGGGDAVQVEIAEHEDMVAAADGGLQRIGGLGKPGDDVGVAPIALQRRREETVRGFRGVDAARDERGRDEVRHVQLALQACDRLGLCRLDVESGRHGGYLLIAVLSYSSSLLSHKCMAPPPGSAAVGGQGGKRFGR